MATLNHSSQTANNVFGIALPDGHWFLLVEDTYVLAELKQLMRENARKLAPAAIKYQGHIISLADTTLPAAKRTIQKWADNATLGFRQEHADLFFTQLNTMRANRWYLRPGPI